MFRFPLTDSIQSTDRTPKPRTTLQKKKAARDEAIAEAVALAVAVYDEREKCSYERAVKEALEYHPAAPRLMVLNELRMMRPKRRQGRQKGVQYANSKVSKIVADAGKVASNG